VQKNPENAEGADSSSENADSTAGASVNPQLLQALERLRSGGWLDVRGYRIRESETTPPKRYNSGTMILAMENAGSLIEDESLREQIRGAGIGTSATRADILKKLVNNRYIALNKKTQILTPTQLGEMIYDVVSCSIAPLLRPDLTASWEKGLNYVSDGSITPEEYMDKLTGFVIRRTNAVKELNNQGMLRQAFNSEAKYYKQWKPTSTWNNENHSSSKKGESNGKK
jgi:DNA topoisomerase-3